MISIIGAGPVGSYLGWLLAKRGKDVKIFEEHNQVGLPVQCAGFLTAEVEKLIRLDKGCVVNRVNAVRVVSPDKNSVEINLKKKEIVVDRRSFDRCLADKAVDAGAELYLNHCFTGIKKDAVVVRDKKKGKNREFKSEHIIGADGPQSTVAKAAGLFKNRQLRIGMQARVRLKCDPNIYETYLGNSFPGLLRWVVPESDGVARIGLISKKNTLIYFRRFLKNRMGINWKRRVLEFQGGLIPVYSPQIETNRGNVFLVGDAASHIKNTTAGGIVPGLVAANALCDSIVNNKDYRKEWKNKLGKELWMHYKLRRILDRFSDRDYNYLIRLCKNGRVKKVIEGESREFPSRMILKLILNEPRFLRFIKFLLKS